MGTHGLVVVLRVDALLDSNARRPRYRRTLVLNDREGAAKFFFRNVQRIVGAGHHTLIVPERRSAKSVCAREIGRR